MKPRNLILITCLLVLVSCKNNSDGKPESIIRTAYGGLQLGVPVKEGNKVVDSLLNIGKLKRTSVSNRPHFVFLYNDLFEGKVKIYLFPYIKANHNNIVTEVEYYIYHFVPSITGNPVDNVLKFSRNLENFDIICSEDGICHPTSSCGMGIDNVVLLQTLKKFLSQKYGAPKDSTTEADGHGERLTWSDDTISVTLRKSWQPFTSSDMFITLKYEYAAGFAARHEMLKPREGKDLF